MNDTVEYINSFRNIALPPLQQGDIFLWSSPDKSGVNKLDEANNSSFSDDGFNGVSRNLIENSDSESFFKIGIIITADCDIHNKKYFGQLNYVPGINLTDYIYNYWVVNFLKKTCEKYKLQIASYFKSELIKKFKNFPFGDMPFISLDQIANTLRCDESERKILMDKFKKQSEYINDLNDVDEKNTDELLNIAFKYFNSNTLCDALSAHLKEPGGDLYLLNNLNVNGRVSDYMILLRYIRQVDVNKIGLNNNDIIRSAENITCYRIGSLKSPYKYYLTRKVAATFADIGLPFVYEESVTQTAQLASRELSMRKTEVKA